jgi:hypothetical protein
MGLPLLCRLLTGLCQEGCPRIQAKTYQRHKGAEEAKNSSNKTRRLKKADCEVDFFCMIGYDADVGGKRTTRF